MKVCIVISDEEAGYLSKLLRLRYLKGRKIALSTLILLAAKESAAEEAAQQLAKKPFEDI